MLVVGPFRFVYYVRTFSKFSESDALWARALDSRVSQEFAVIAYSRHSRQRCGEPGLLSPHVMRAAHLAANLSAFTADRVGGGIAVRVIS